MMKTTNQIRQDKLATLKAALSGDADAVRRYQQRFPVRVFTVQFVDYSQGEAEQKPLQPTDLVDTKLPNQQGQSRVTYVEFLANPTIYGNCCFSIDD